MLEPYTGGKGGWVNPLLPLFALALLGGVFFVKNDQNSEGVHANVLKEFHSEVPCTIPEEVVVSECQDNTQKSGKQIWICQAEKKWEKWGGCTDKNDK